MISSNQIERLVRNGEHAQLLDRILANGRCPSPIVRTWLSRHAALPPLALGLAVQRLCELTYGPCPRVEATLRRLLRHQQPGGGFGDDGRVCPAATATAARGLLDGLAAHRITVINDEHGTSEAHRPGAYDATDLEQAAEAALRAVADWAGGPEVDPVTASAVLWQLGDHPAFRCLVAKAQLVHTVNASLERRDVAAELRDLGRVALAMAA